MQLQIRKMQRHMHLIKSTSELTLAKVIDAYELNPREVALLCVLLLRGPQMLGELRIRTERLHAFASVGEVEECLRGLSEGAEPLVRELPARPGQKENRFVQLLSGEPGLDEPPATEIRPAVASGPTRVETLEAEVATLKSEVAALREEFARFRKQLE